MKNFNLVGGIPAKQTVEATVATKLASITDITTQGQILDPAKPFSGYSFERDEISEWLLEHAQNIPSNVELVNGKMVVTMQPNVWSMDFPSRVDCCFSTPELNACVRKTALDYICLKDCVSFTEQIYEDIRRVSDADLRIDGVSAKGMLLSDVRVAWNKLVMDFLTRRHLVAGIDNPMIATPGLKSFPGLANVFTKTAEVEVIDLIAALASMKCWMDKTGLSDYIIFTSYPVYTAFEQAYTRLGDKAAAFGFTRGANGVLVFNGAKILRSPFFIYDTDNGVGDFYVASASALHTWLWKRSSLSDVDKKTFIVENGSDDDMCGNECVRYHNIGGVGINDLNLGMKYTGVQISAACGGKSLSGMAGYFNQSTPFPAKA